MQMAIPLRPVGAVSNLRVVGAWTGAADQKTLMARTAIVSKTLNS